jgi:hypothetical protein
MWTSMTSRFKYNSHSPNTRLTNVGCKKVSTCKIKMEQILMKTDKKKMSKSQNISLPDLKSLKLCYQISPGRRNRTETKVIRSELNFPFQFYVVHLRATWELTKVPPVKWKEKPKWKLYFTLPDLKFLGFLFSKSWGSQYEWKECECVSIQF